MLRTPLRCKGSTPDPHLNRAVGERGPVFAGTDQIIERRCLGVLVAQLCFVSASFVKCAFFGGLVRTFACSFTSNYVP